MGDKPSRWTTGRAWRACGQTWQMGSDFHRGSVLVYSSQPGGKNLVPSNQKSFTSVLLVKDEWNPEIGENIFFDCLTMICYEDLSHFDFSGRQKKCSFLAVKWCTTDQKPDSVSGEQTSFVKRRFVFPSVVVVIGVCQYLHRTTLSLGLRSVATWKKFVFVSYHARGYVGSCGYHHQGMEPSMLLGKEWTWF